MSLPGTANRECVEVLHELERLAQGKVCVLGVGNRYRRDDGAGSVIAGELERQTSALVIDGGSAPENYLEKVARTEPDTIIIVDAVDFDGVPGEIRLLEPDAVRRGRVSTHGPSLAMTTLYLKARTRARLTLLAIQPAEIGLGEGLSEAVSGTVALLREMLAKVLDESKTNRMETV